MRIFLMLTGAVIAIGALLFWIVLNGLAASWNTGASNQFSVRWFTEEALLLFWLPFAAGAAIALLGWRRK